MGVIVLSAGAAFVPASLRAQYPKREKEPPGSLDGAVVSAKGAPVANALIIWEAADGGKPHVLRSDAQGRFQIADLRPGLYELRASAKGRASEWSHNVLVRPGAEASVSLRLTLTAPSDAPTSAPPNAKAPNTPPGN